MRTTSNPRYSVCIIAALAVLLAAPDGLMAGKPDQPGRESPASLDMETPGCPTWFGDPSCEYRTTWDLDKTTDAGQMVNPDGEIYVFDVTVEKGEKTFLKGTGEIVLTNSGGQDALVSSVVLLLEESTPGIGDAPGPGGNNWSVLATAVDQEWDDPAPDGCGDTAYTCSDDGSGLQNDYLAALVVYQEGYPLFPAEGEPMIGPTIDNDGDTVKDEDPEDGINNDGDCLDAEGMFVTYYNECKEWVETDGKDGFDDRKEECLLWGCSDDLVEGIDEDGACLEPDKTVYPFEFEFDITDIAPAGSTRLDMLVTFGNAGARGGSGASCQIDINCNDERDSFEVDMTHAKKEGPNVRTLQRRLSFDLPTDCEGPTCSAATLLDAGATTDASDCIELTTDTINEDIDGDVVRLVGGAVSCACGPYIDELQDELDDAAGPDGLVTMWVQYPYSGGDSYFNTTLTGCEPDYDAICGGGQKTYDGWCMDTDRTIGNGTHYQASLVSSYDSLVADRQMVEHPENLDRVNWIINQDFLEKSIGGCGGLINYADIQRAIWALVEDANSTAGLYGLSDCRANEITKLACGGVGFLGKPNAVVGQECPGEVGGEPDPIEGFVPDCSQSVAVLLNPLETGNDPPATVSQITIAQITLITFPSVCPSQGPPCYATVTNEATLTCLSAGGDDLIEGSPALSSFLVFCDCGY